MPVFEKLTAFGFSPDGLSTHRYLLLGDTRQPVAILLSGYTHVHSAFSDLARHLQRYYCVVIPDLPGWESTSQVPFTISEYTRYIRSLIDFLGLKSVSFIAHCAGAALAVDFATIHSSRAKELFLVSVPHFEGLFPTPAFMRSRLIEPVKHHIKGQSAHVPEALAKHWESYTQFSFRKIARLSLPVHLIHGGNDSFVPPQKVHGLKGKSKRVTFDMVLGAGHTPSIERPEALAAVILSYATRVSALS